MTMEKFIQWQGDYSVKVKRMDLHHRVIVYLINSLYEKNQSQDLEGIKEAISLLDEFIVTHFIEEEHFMELIGYQDMENHKIIHKKLLNELRIHATDYQSNGGKFQQVFFDFLKMWVISHICRQDTKYAATVHQQAI